MWTRLTLVALLMGLVACELKSPCPKLFQYGDQKEGLYEGTLVLSTEYKLHGVWIRVMFDNDVKELKSLDGKLEVKSSPDDARQFLIKDRDMVLKKGEPAKVRISVGYVGSPPALIGYRLNARDVCPEGQD